jgi:hypothetical protein
VLRAGVTAACLAALVLVSACSGRDRPARLAPEPPPPTVDAAAAPDATAADAPAVAAADPPVALAVIRSLPGIDLVESATHASHGHGGPPASIDAAQLNFEVRDQRAHDVAVTKLELLRASCGEATWSQRTRLTVTGHEVYPWTGYDPIARGGAGVTLPAGGPRRLGVKVLFAPITAYQACDRFAFAIELTVDRVPVTIETPLLIKRYQPMPGPTP